MRVCGTDNRVKISNDQNPVVRSANYNSQWTLTTSEQSRDQLLSKALKCLPSWFAIATAAATVTAAVTTTAAAAEAATTTAKTATTATATRARLAWFGFVNV